MSYRYAYVGIILLVLSLALLAFDRALILHLPFPDETLKRLVSPWTIVGKTRNASLLCLVGTLGTIVFAHLTKRNLSFSFLPLFAWFHMLISGLVVQIIKWLSGRPRPELAVFDDAMSWQPMEGLSTHVSFPSGHANLALAIGLVFSYTCPHQAGRVLILCLALSMGVTRVLLYKHYVSDVLAGWSVACMTMLCYEPFLRLSNNHLNNTNGNAEH